MRMINRETFFSIALFATSLFSYSTPVSADEPCLPCGQVITNSPGVGYDTPVTPYMNYMATSSCCKNLYNYFGGFYVGVGWGVGIVDWNIELQNPGVPGVNNLTGLDSDSRSYLVGIGNAGFNLVVGYFSLGIEVGYNYRSRTNPTSYFDTVDFQLLADLVLDPPEDTRIVATLPCKVRFDINAQHAATIDLLPGFVYKRFTTYLRLGVEHTKFDFQRRVCFPAVTIDDDLFEADIDNIDYVFSPPSQSKTGYRVGLGFGIAATNHISFHLNFVHTFSEKVTYSPDVTDIIANFPVIVDPIGDAFIVNRVSQLGSNITIEPQRNEVNFGVRWTF